MKVVSYLLLLAFLINAGVADAQIQVGARLKQIEIRDMENKPAKIPCFGEKHLLIFYVDPDHPSQNKEFTDYLEKNQIKSDKIYSFGVVNLKDAPLLPNALVRSMVRKKMKSTGATIYSDPDHLLSDGWGLGDVNNQFCILFITKDGVLKFIGKGELTEAEQKKLMAIIKEYS